MTLNIVEISTAIKKLSLSLSHSRAQIFKLVRHDEKKKKKKKEKKEKKEKKKREGKKKTKNSKVTVGRLKKLSRARHAGSACRQLRGDLLLFSILEYVLQLSSRELIHRCAYKLRKTNGKTRARIHEEKQIRCGHRAKEKDGTLR
jgi:hypothetical protein